MTARFAAPGTAICRTIFTTTITNGGGRSVDDRRLFEKICLEGFQSGLSWLTILRKRENFRAAFDNFDRDKVAEYTDEGRRAPAGRQGHRPPSGENPLNHQQRQARARTG
jgi:hypothetical protein